MSSRKSCLTSYGQPLTSKKIQRYYSTLASVGSYDLRDAETRTESLNLVIKTEFIV